MIFTVTNKNGAEATFSSLGARIMSLKVPDKEGNLIDVIEGFDTEEEYAEKGKSQGAICGRYANKISNATFVIEGETYNLEKNKGEHCLHSGNFYLRLVEYKGDSFGKQVHFTYSSANLEAGFPGNLDVEITYTLTDENCLKIQLCAKTDHATHVNLTSHPYFNLDGEGSGSVLDHHLKIKGDSVLEFDQEGIPTGSFIDVADTGFDFREEAVVSENIAIGHPQISMFNGFDHCFTFNAYEEGELKEIATLRSLETGIGLIVSSTYPGVQLYTANAEKKVGKGGNVYNNHSALCLEPQFYPDSPNRPEFPSTLLQPGDHYDHVISFQFVVHG